MRENKDDFEPFLFADEHTSAKDIEEYCQQVENTALWGGEMEITALSRALELPVEIYSKQTVRPLVIQPNPVNEEVQGEKLEKVVRLSLYEHMYGLGQHYNSVFKDGNE